MLIHHRQRTGPAQESHHGVTDGKIGHFGTGLKHHPGAFGTQRWGLAGIHP